MNKQKNAFTLVELIVVITILAILGTIAFLAFQGYSASARDSKRIADMNTIKTSLELFGLNSGKFPDPVNPVFITYSSGTINNLNLRQQGIFGQQNVTNVSSAGKLDRLPKDPLTELEYTYSVTLNKKEFELGTILENDEVAFSPVNLVNAASKKVVSAFIKGNYNGKIIKTSSGTTSYIFAVPSIINSDSTLTDIKDLISPVNKIAYNGFANLPASYDGPTFEVNGAPNSSFVNPNEILVFSGSNYSDLINPEDSSARLDLLENIKNAYSGTDLASEGGIREIVECDPSNPSNTEENLAGIIVNDELGGNIKIVPNSGTGNTDNGGNEEGETLVCENMTETNVNNLNELGFGYTKEQWCTSTDLDLGGSELTSIPDEIGYLTNLQSLRLYENQLTSLPNTLSNLTNLTELDIDTNNFSTYPDVISELTSLESLWLYGNELTTLPTTITNLTNLTELDISDNNFTTFPNITTLSNLISLSISNNGLTGLSSNIANLTNLTELELNGNDLLGDFSNNFYTRDTFDIEGESNDGKLITIIGGGTTLVFETETISYANTCDELTQEIANILNSTFSVGYSKEKWCNLETLEYHGSEGCGVYNDTNNNILSNIFKNIIPVVNAGECDAIPYLTTLPSEIGYLIHLTTLNLSNNKLTYLPSEIKNLTNLNILNLEYNDLGNLSYYFDATISDSKTEIGITPDDKDITITTGGGNINVTATDTIFPNTCSNITQSVADTLNTAFGFNYSKEKWCNLTNLNLSNKNLTSIPSQITYLEYLENLNLEYNDLGYLSYNFNKDTEIEKTAFAITPDNKNITISAGGGNINITSEDTTFDNQCNNITQEIANILNTSFSVNYTKEKWCNLTNLDFSNKYLSSIPNEIQYLENLESLNLNYNSLSTLPNTIGNLNNLKSLYLYNNSLDELPPEIGNLENLENLMLGYNNGVNLPEEIGNLNNLKYLNLGWIKLYSIPDWIFNLENLEILDLTDIGLTGQLTTDIGSLTKLKNLGLHFNDLTSLPDQFCNLTQLTTLDIAWNKLTTLPTNFGNLTNLEDAQLFSNNISKLPNSIGQLYKLKSLNLSDNDILGYAPNGLSRRFKNTEVMNRYKSNVTPDGKSIRIITNGSSSSTLNISVY